MRADLCVEAYERACQADGALGMILHSDRGRKAARTSTWTAA
jgi:hypothetical protein